jgi:tyrosine-protein phosphatase SIW14
MNSLISSTSELNINCGNAPPKTQSLLVPPLNFAMVNPGVYRAGHPNKKNFKFLKKLQLKSIIYLCPDDYTPEMIEFCEENNIKVFQYFIKGNKVR